MAEPKTLSQTYAESGRQNILDTIGATPGGLEKAEAAYSSGTLPNFRSTAEAQAWLNGAQTTAIQSMGNSSSNLPSPTDLISTVTGALGNQGGAPERPKLLETYSQLRSEQNLTELEQQLIELQAQEEDIIATKRQRTGLERDKPVAQNVIEGRVGMVERQEAERIDLVRRQIQTKTDQINTAYKVIGTIMDLTTKDYELAKDEYDTKFSQTMQVTELLRGLRRDEMDEKQYFESTARANLQIYANAIQGGNLSYADLTPAQKTEITQLEVKSGLPPGFISNLKLNPKDQIVFTNSNNGVTQVGVQNPDGTISVRSYGTSSAKATEAEKNGQAQSDMFSRLQRSANSYGHVTPDEYNKNRKLWISAGLDPLVYDERFRVFRDPNRTDNAYDLSGTIREEEYGRAG